jgi:hypothetical protein
VFEQAIVTFGLGDLGMGIFLVVVNLVIVVLVLWYGFKSYQVARACRQDLRTKANFVENAVGFDAKAFREKFDEIARGEVPTDHTLVFFYTSLRLSSMARHSGIPAQKRFGGVPLSKRQPHATTPADVEVFQLAEDSSSYAPKQGDGHQFPGEVVLSLALPTHLLTPLLGHEDDSQLCRVPEYALRFMRPDQFDAVVDPAPWLDGLALLPPTSILSSSAMARERRAVGPQDTVASTKWAGHEFGHLWIEHMNDLRSVRVERPRTTLEFVECMREARAYSSDSGLVPLFHYTSADVAPMVLRSGLRMNVTRKDDGGVFFSMFSPASYGLGEVCRSSQSD